MKYPLRFFKSVAFFVLLSGFLAPRLASAQDGMELVENSNFETDTDGDSWPDTWPKLKVGGSWEKEADNHFLRLTSPAPGTMVMLYREIRIPSSVKAFEITWKHRISNLQTGAKPWFDARFMMEYMTASRARVTPGPKVPNFRKNIADWKEERVQCVVPEGAAILKFMPSLFLVNGGTWDIDDLEIKSIDPSTLGAEPEKPKDPAPDAGSSSSSSTTPAAPAKVAIRVPVAVQEDGSLIPNGNFEGDQNGDAWPDSWGHTKVGGSWEMEDNNHFVRLNNTVPGQMVMLYQLYGVPPETSALELKWRQRVVGLKKGKMPWFDARILIQFQDSSGTVLQQKPNPAYTQKDTAGWVERSTQFLVPENAVTVVLMPSLFQTEAGTFDLDDFSLKPTDPTALREAKKEADRALANRYVPPEEPNHAKWPKMLKVVGNRLHDTDGKEVWLQGVNCGNLETLPADKQVIKSTVVAIDEWKSNCVRIPIKESFWFGQSPYQKDGGKDYRDTIDQIVTLASNRGAYVVLDLHRFRAPNEDCVTFWKDAATHFKDHPAVLFDLFNEPHGITWEVWRNGGFVGEKKGTDESAFLSEEEKKKNQGFQSVGMQALVNAVRSTGAKNIVIAGGLVWCNDLSGIVKGYALEDKTGNGIMYSWHTYNWHHGWERVLPVAQKYPIFLGEVGADIKKMDFIAQDIQENPYTFIPDMLGFIQKNKINWTGWCLHPKATPVLISDWNYTPTPFWGAFAKRALAGEAFEMKKMR